MPAGKAGGYRRMLLPAKYLLLFRYSVGHGDNGWGKICFPCNCRFMKKSWSALRKLRTLIASGDVYIRAEESLQDIPEADVVCYGLWVDPVLATHHGVFVSDRKQPEALDFMLQKPTLAELGQLSKTHLFLMDIGIWILSDRAVDLLVKRSQKPDDGSRKPYSDLRYYDLYSDFGLALGNHPRIADEELNALSVAILPLPGGEFYHYGTSRELLSSTVTLQNKVYDQRQIIHRKMKPNPAIFVQNAEIHVGFSSDNDNVWIENSFVGERWKLGKRQIITGVPYNNWELNLPDGVCVDIVPLSDARWAVRPYGFDDVFKGDLKDEKTMFLGKPFLRWLDERGLTAEGWSERTDDLQAASLFPVVSDAEQMGKVLNWMVTDPMSKEGKDIWLQSERLSADEISAQADLRLLYAQRESFRKRIWRLWLPITRKAFFIS